MFAEFDIGTINTDTGPTSYISWSHFIVSTMQAGTNPIFNVFGMTQQQLGIGPTNPLGQSWVPPYHRLLLSAGATEDLLVTRELH